MRRLAYLTIIVLFATTLGACAQATPQPTDEMINPGDKIGDLSLQVVMRVLPTYRRSIAPSTRVQG